MKRAFTLVEVLVTFAVFAIVMSIVLVAMTGLFRNWQQGREMLQREQKQRRCMLLLSKEVASLTRITYPQKAYFEGTLSEFFLAFAKEDELVESRYKYNPDTKELEHYYESPTDYSDETYDGMDICMSELNSCSFTYSDGSTWADYWNQSRGQVPRMLKINFRLTNDTRDRELIVNIPVSQ